MVRASNSFIEALRGTRLYYWGSINWEKRSLIKSLNTWGLLHGNRSVPMSTQSTRPWGAMSKRPKKKTTGHQFWHSWKVCPLSEGSFRNTFVNREAEWQTASQPNKISGLYFPFQTKLRLSCTLPIDYYGPNILNHFSPVSLLCSFNSPSFIYSFLKHSSYFPIFLLKNKQANKNNTKTFQKF